MESSGNSSSILLLSWVSFASLSSRTSAASLGFEVVGSSWGFSFSGGRRGALCGTGPPLGGPAGLFIGGLIYCIGGRIGALGAGAPAPGPAGRLLGYSLPVSSFTSSFFYLYSKTSFYSGFGGIWSGRSSPASSTLSSFFSSTSALGGFEVGSLGAYSVAGGSLFSGLSAYSCALSSSWGFGCVGEPAIGGLKGAWPLPIMGGAPLPLMLIGGAPRPLTGGPPLPLTAAGPPPPLPGGPLCAAPGPPDFLFKYSSVHIVSILSVPTLISRRLERYLVPYMIK